MKNNKFLKNSILVMILIIIGKVLALVRDSLIAAKFGTTYITDVYTFSLGVVYLLTTISYGITTTFIPVHSEYIENKGVEKSRDFVNNIINVTSVATIIITLTLLLFSKPIIDIFAPGFKNDINAYNNSILILRIMLGSLLFISIQSVIAGVLQVHKQFLEPAAMAAASNVVYIAYLILLTRKYGIVGFAGATVLAFFMQLIINIPKYRKLGYKYKPIFNLREKELKTIFTLMIPVVISTSLIQLNMFINRSFATSIYPGAVTVLEFANKINTLAYEVFAIGIAMIIFPTLAENIAKGDIKEYKSALNKGINTILLIMVPAAFAIAMLRFPLITVIFKRGAFGQNSLLLTSSALLFFCPAMIAYSLRDILNKAFYAVKDTKTPMINSFIGIILNVVLNLVFASKMGVAGLTLSTSIASAITAILMLLGINKKLSGINISKTLGALARITLASIAMAACIFFTNNLCALRFGTGMNGSIISIIVSFCIGTTVYFLAIYMLKVEEFHWLVNSLIGKMKKERAV